MHRKVNAPRRGSLAYRPRGRARSISGRIRFWPRFEGVPTLLGFAGYKAGMTHVYMIEDKPRSPHLGKEIFHPVTIIEAPPMLVCGIRTYTETTNGLKTLSEVWFEKPPKSLARKFSLPDSFKTEEAMNAMSGMMDKIAEIRLLLCTQPELTAFGKKKPDLMEVKVDGSSLDERFEYAKSLLGKEVHVSDVFKPGQFIDVLAVTKGKGFQGPVKRHGIKTLSHKARKATRAVGSIGPWHPAHVMSTVPRAGQMGFSQRIKYNKRILRIGSDGSEVTPKGGFLRYGAIKGEYLLVSGSVPGSSKRLTKLRYPARGPAITADGEPQIIEVSQRSMMA